MRISPRARRTSSTARRTASGKPRARTRAYLEGHGLGRHNASEIVWLAGRSLDSLAASLDGKPYFVGAAPCGADATMFGMLAGIPTPFFDAPLRDAALRHDSLVAYRDRMMTRFYPEFARQAA